MTVNGRPAIIYSMGLQSRIEVIKLFPFIFCELSGMNSISSIPGELMKTNCIDAVNGHKLRPFLSLLVRYKWPVTRNVNTPEFYLLAIFKKNIAVLHLSKSVFASRRI